MSTFVFARSAANGADLPSSPLVITITINAGETAFLSISSTATSTANLAAVGTISGGGAWALIGTKTLNNVRTEIWATSVVGAATAAASVSVPFTGTVKTIQAVVDVYTGGAAFGQVVTQSGNAATPSIAITTTDANNKVLGAFGSEAGVDGGASTGTARGTWSNSDAFVSGDITVVENTSATPASVTVGTNQALAEYAIVAVELRSTTGVASAPTPRPTFTRSVPTDPQYRALRNMAMSALAPAAVATTANKVPWHLFPPLTMRQPSRWRRRRAHALG